MAKQNRQTDLQNLPPCAAELIRQVIKKMCYRKKARRDVRAELAAHFDDELKDCANDQEKEQKAQQLIADFGDAKLLAVLVRRAKKRCRPLWRTIVARTAQALGVLIVWLFIYSLWFYSGRAVITTDYVALLNQLVRPAVDESLNAAPYYNEAASLIEELPEDISAVLHKTYREAAPKQRQLMQEWLTDNPQALDLLAIGSKKPHCWRVYKSDESGTIIGVLVPSLSEFRKLARLLRWRSRLRAAQGRYDEAFDDVKVCYRFGRHIGENAFLVEQLVGIAIEAIAAQNIRDIVSDCRIDLKTLAALQRDFEQMIASEDFTMNLRAESLCMYDEIQRCFTGGADGHIIPKRIMQLLPEVQIITTLGSTDTVNTSSAEKQKPGWLSRFISDVRCEIGELGDVICETGRFTGKAGYVLFLHPDKQQTSVSAEKLYDYWGKLADKTPAQIRKEGIDVKKETAEIAEGNLLLVILRPALERVNELCHRHRANLQAMLMVLAVMRCEREKGSYPAGLEELLRAGYLKNLPMDPYGDKPLVYKRTGDDFILYSLGPDFEDNGGKPSTDSKGRLKQWQDDGDTIFWPVPKSNVKD